MKTEEALVQETYIFARIYWSLIEESKGGTKK